MATIQVRKDKKGKVHYRVQVRLKGHESETATFTRLTDAREWASSKESALREGRHFVTREAKRHTLSDAIDRYLRDVMPGKKMSTRMSQESQLEWWRARMGDYKLADIRPAVIAEARDELLSGKTRQGTQRSNAAVVRYLAVLSHLFTKARKEWQWVTDTPFRNIEKPKEPRGRVRFLSDDERTKLLAECKKSQNPMLYDIVVLALCTGMRKGEIMGLHWSNVDLQRGVITLTDTKNGEVRAVPVVGAALESLKTHARIRRLDTNLVFAAPERDGAAHIENAWRAAKKRAGLEDFKFHDLRHTAASYLLMSGASTIEIAETLGHRTLQMAKRYSHASISHRTKLAERLEAAVFAQREDGAL